MSALQRMKKKSIKTVEINVESKQALINISSKVRLCVRSLALIKDSLQMAQNNSHARQLCAVLWCNSLIALGPLMTDTFRSITIFLQYLLWYVSMIKNESQKNKHLYITYALKYHKIIVFAKQLAI